MTHARPVASEERLRERLDELVETFDFSTITPDPLELVYRYENDADRETAALFAAAFAYGRADIVVRNVGSVLDSMGPSPHQFVRAFEKRRHAKRFRQFTHRFHKASDLTDLIERVGAVLRAHGTLGECFRELYDPGERDVGGALERFVSAILRGGGTPAAPSVRYLLSSPADGSACKRMNLFLRWMVRRTPPDLGLWDFVDPAKLVIPLDTHVHRITTFLGLCDRKSADWKAARAVTDRLSALDPSDPVRYDFAICRLGILDRCSRRQSAEQCRVCLLRDVCRFPVG